MNLAPNPQQGRRSIFEFQVAVRLGWRGRKVRRRAAENVPEGTLGRRCARFWGVAPAQGEGRGEATKVGEAIRNIYICRAGLSGLAEQREAGGRLEGFQDGVRAVGWVRKSPNPPPASCGYSDHRKVPRARQTQRVQAYPCRAHHVHPVGRPARKRQTGPVIELLESSR